MIYRTVIEWFPEHVLQPMQEATESILIKLGAFIRVRVRNSLQYSRKASQPGQPPAVHRIHRKSYQQSSSPLRDFILFDVNRVDSEITEMVAGPAAITGRTSAAEKLEKGGTVKTKSGATISIRPRPFMAPAFEAETMGVSEMWSNAI